MKKSFFYFVFFIGLFLICISKVQATDYSCSEYSCERWNNEGEGVCSTVKPWVGPECTIKDVNCSEKRVVRKLNCENWGTECVACEGGGYCVGAQTIDMGNEFFIKDLYVKITPGTSNTCRCNGYITISKDGSEWASLGNIQNCKRPGCSQWYDEVNEQVRFIKVACACCIDGWYFKAYSSNVYESFNWQLIVTVVSVVGTAGAFVYLAYLWEKAHKKV
jgi:hypothetical protein